RTNVEVSGYDTDQSEPEQLVQSQLEDEVESYQGSQYQTRGGHDKMGRWLDQARRQYSPTPSERVLVTNLKVISALEIKIIIEHVTGNLDQARTEQREQESAPVEDAQCFPSDHPSEYDGHEGRLQERDPHRLKPQPDERRPFRIDALVG